MGSPKSKDQQLTFAFEQGFHKLVEIDLCNSKISWYIKAIWQLQQEQDLKFIEQDLKFIKSLGQDK